MSDAVADDAAYEALQRILADHAAVLAYFTGRDCGVCKVLKPKVLELLKSEFPHVHLFEVDCQAQPALAARLGVLSVPTVVLYFDGREGARFVRLFAIGDLRDALMRPYRLLFD
jgi:thioredoxin-like negative regulator of GroEL